MKILVVGCGSIGKRHISILQKLGINDISICDISEDKLNQIGENFNISKRFIDYQDALKNKVDAVFICTPPNSHLSIASDVLKKGYHMFIEKPLSHTLEGVDDFVKEVKDRKIKVAIGYMMRFHPGILKVKQLLDKKVIGDVYSVCIYGGQYLPDWHPQSDYREEYSARRELGGGIILDATHELDYSIWLFGKPREVFCYYEKISNLEIDTEDIFSMVVKTEKRVTVEIHGDYLQRSYERRCQISGEKGTIVWDHNQRATKLYTADKKKWEVFPVDVSWDYIYEKELRHFLDCIKKDEKPMVNEEDGLLALRFAVAAKKSGNEKRIVQFSDV